MIIINVFDCKLRVLLVITLIKFFFLFKVFSYSYVQVDFVLNGSDKFSASASRGLRRGWSEIGEDGGMSALATVLRDAGLDRFMSAALRQNV